MNNNCRPHSGAFARHLAARIQAGYFLVVTFLIGNVLIGIFYRANGYLPLQGSVSLCPGTYASGVREYMDKELERDCNGVPTGLVREQPDDQAIEHPYESHLSPAKDPKLVPSWSQADPKRVQSGYKAGTRNTPLFTDSRLK